MGQFSIKLMGCRGLFEQIWLWNQSKSFQGDRKCDVSTIANYMFSKLFHVNSALIVSNIEF